MPRAIQVASLLCVYEIAVVTQVVLVKRHVSTVAGRLWKHQVSLSSRNSPGSAGTAARKQPPARRALTDRAPKAKALNAGHNHRRLKQSTRRKASDHATEWPGLVVGVVALAVGGRLGMRCRSPSLSQRLPAR